MNPRYLNVDCILSSDLSLESLMQHLENDIFILWSESSLAGSKVGFETKLFNTIGPEEDILEFFRLFEKLPSPLLELLRNCKEKIFDIGYEGGGEGALDTHLNATVINQLCQFGFSLNIRVYSG